MKTSLAPTLAVKLAALVVHADEASGPTGHGFDMIAMRSIVDDPEVAEWLATFDAALLPVKRGSR